MSLTPPPVELTDTELAMRFSALGLEAYKTQREIARRSLESVLARLVNAVIVNPSVAAGPQTLEEAIEEALK